MCLHSGVDAMLSSCVPRSLRRVMNECVEGMITSQSTKKENQLILTDQCEQNNLQVLPDWQRMQRTLEEKYQDYLKGILKQCKEIHAPWDMDILIKAGRAITKQDDETLQSVICETHDEHGFTFAHTLIQDPDKLFELIKQNHISFGHNKHNFSALDYAIKNLEGYTQDVGRITLDPEGFERASCSVYILLNYVKMITSRHSAERVKTDDFGSCCDKHIFPLELDFIESKLIKSDMLALFDQYSKSLEQKLVNNSFNVGSPCQESIAPMMVDVKENGTTHIVVLSDEHVTSKEKGLIFVPFGSKLQSFKGEPKNGSKVIVKYYDCYLWGLVRGRAVNNDIGIIFKNKDGVPCGNIFSLNELYELFQEEKK